MALVQNSLYFIILVVLLISFIEMLFIPLYQYLLTSSITKEDAVLLLPLAIIPVAIGDSLGAFLAVLFSNSYL